MARDPGVTLALGVDGEDQDLGPGETELAGGAHHNHSFSLEE